MKRSNSRLFSLYLRNGKRFERLSSSSYDKAKAESMFQAAVTAGTIAGLTVQVRPVNETAKPKGDPDMAYRSAYRRFTSMVLPNVEGKVWFVPSGSAEWAVTTGWDFKIAVEQRQKAAFEAAMSEASL